MVLKEINKHQKKMKHQKERKIKSALILFLIGILTVSTIALAAEQSIVLIDVSTGDTQEDSACIFKVNGKTVVVDRRDKVTVDGITIYVQEVYPVNSESKTGDRCEFIYSGMEEEKESEIKEEIIGETVVQFYFGDKEETETGEVEEVAMKEVGDSTVVRISGYDVTGLSIDAKDNEEQTSTTTEEPKESKGILAKIFSWIFG
ncbi:hypothetical protein HZC31_04075 [Candidatus Woesearchaeota archaeon]|nr:hypothetical protein [Candidatus Woesearchaeota archaeon]